MYKGIYRGDEGDISFRCGGKIPQLGFGTGTGYNNRPNDIPDGMCLAFQAGYRLFDTAQVYGTEAGVGMGLTRLVEQQGVARDEVFLLSKVESSFMLLENQQKIRGTVEKSLELMMVETLDLMLLHSPGVRTNAERFLSRVPKDQLHKVPRTPEDCSTARVEAWEVLQECLKDGLVKHIGVSNWNEEHLDQLLQNPRCTHVPELNQIENHPYHVGQQVIDYCNSNGILVQGYAALGNGRSDKASDNNRDLVLDDLVLADIAKSAGCTSAQICLRWALQKGILPVIKSENEARLKENIDTLQIKPLAKQDIEKIDTLNKGQNIFLGWYDMM